MSAAFTLYGWQLSYYSGKVRCYLDYKRIPYVEEAVDLPTLMIRIRRRTGAVVMPVVVTPEGGWLQDSSEIIDQLEARFPARAIVPYSPVQRFAASVLEAWGDEWWIPFAMHTRWSHPENLDLFVREAGAALLPWAPAFVQQRAARVPVAAMRDHLRGVGVVPAQHAAMDAWLHDMLDALDAHFEATPFLLGPRPTLADFGLVGPLYAHLGRDPWPKRELIAPRRQLQAWVDRMVEPAAAEPAAFDAGDELPATLAPVWHSVFGEFLPMIEAINARVRAALPSLPAGRAFPRGLDEVGFPMGKGTFRRAALPYTLWMVQRSQDVYRAMAPDDQVAVRAWLATVGGARWLEIDVPRLRRCGLRVAPEVA